MSTLTLRHANKNRLGAIDWGPDDFDVLDTNRCVGRIFMSQQAPQGRPCFWTITAREYPPTTHSRGYSATREQAMKDFKMAKQRSHTVARQPRVTTHLLNGIKLFSSPEHSGEFGDSCNLATKKSRRGSFGIRSHRASPRPVAFLGPPFAKTSGPFFKVLIARSAET
jgi:hypothetical protein